MNCTKKSFITAVLILTLIAVVMTVSVCATYFDTKDNKVRLSANLGVARPSIPSVKNETISPISETALEEVEPDYIPDKADVEAIAKTLYRECRGVKSDMEKAAVAWCILNRVDNPYFPDTVLGVLEQPRQFAYDENSPVWNSLKEIAEDVMIRWHNEKNGEEDCGRILPEDYLYFIGDGKHNHFTIEFLGDDYWDWSLSNPYEN